MIDVKDPDRFKVSHEETVERWESIVEDIRSSVDYPSDHATAASKMHPAVHEIIALQRTEGTDLEIRGELLYVLVTAIEALIGRWIEQSDPVLTPLGAADKQIDINRELMRTKNQAYGSSWSIMRPEGLVDSIHTKIHRIESLLSGVVENKYESVIDSFEDILNYSVFACMRIDLDLEEGLNG